MSERRRKARRMACGRIVGASAEFTEGGGLEGADLVAEAVRARVKSRPVHEEMGEHLGAGALPEAEQAFEPGRGGSRHFRRPYVIGLR